MDTEPISSSFAGSSSGPSSTVGVRGPLPPGPASFPTLMIRGAGLWERLQERAKNQQRIMG